MQRSPKLKEQLDKAQAELKNMEASMTLDELEAHWKEFLSHLERFWYKSQGHFGRSPKWNAWKVPFQKDREKDPLLKYLKLARGAHEHTLEDIAERRPGSFTLSAGPTGMGTIKNLNLDKGVLTGEVTSGTISVTFSPDRVATLPIKDRGGNCPSPNSHLGQPIDPDNLVALARAGYAYYDRFLIETEKYRVTNGDV